MKVYKLMTTKDLITDNRQAYVSIGFFDGVHIGHQKIIKKQVRDAKKNNKLSIVITFAYDLIATFKKSSELSNERQKKQALKELGVDIVYIIQKGSDILSLTGHEFINEVLEKLNTKKVYCGSDFSIGKDFKKSDFIEKFYKIEVIKDVIRNHQKISSTYIKQLVSDGNIKLANKYLYFPYTIISKVIKGKQLGRKIQFNTANLFINDYQLIAKSGVYFGKVKYKHHIYKAMINIGTNPTVDKDNKIKIEVHILDFTEVLYNKQIEVIFLKYHRDEKKFDNIKHLKRQLSIDKKRLIKINF